MNECNICFEVYEDTSSITWLPCFHFLCNGCFHKLRNNLCPFCRDEFSTEQQNVSYSLPNRQVNLMYDRDILEDNILDDNNILEDEHFLQRNRNRNRNTGNNHRRRRRRRNIVSYTYDSHDTIIDSIVDVVDDNLDVVVDVVDDVVDNVDVVDDNIFILEENKSTDDRLNQKHNQNRYNRWNSLNNQTSRYNFR
jgi:hypothetical protein